MKSGQIVIFSQANIRNIFFGNRHVSPRLCYLCSYFCATEEVHYLNHYVARAAAVVTAVVKKIAHNLNDTVASRLFDQYLDTISLLKGKGSKFMTVLFQSMAYILQFITLRVVHK